MTSPAEHPKLVSSPRSKSKPLQRQHHDHSSDTPHLTIRHSTLAPEDEANNEFGQGAIAGPSSPSRRRRRPSASRRRSSSITAAASLISSYSTSSQGRNEDGTKTGDANDAEEGDETVGYEDGEEQFGEDAAETVRDASEALRKGRSSPYHMALVSLLFSLAQGMPLASQIKVYSYMMCQLYEDGVGRPKGPDQSNLSAWLSLGRTQTVPSAPELPSSPLCESVWVENATSTYAAAMAMVGALVSLILLNRCSKLSDYFGRKPLLLATQLLLALFMTLFRLSVLLPTYVGVCVLYISVVVLEASAGAPLKIAIQNYVVDTTHEQQRAGALSFTEGFGQVGAFPSSTLGGWLAAVTQEFFSPFYASIAVYAVSSAYVLLFVPESKKRRHHTLIDDFERFGQDSSSEHEAYDGRGDSFKRASHKHDDDGDTTDGDTDGGVATESYYSSLYEANGSDPWWKSILHRYNFLAPLIVFMPNCRNASMARTSVGRKWRLFILAVIVIAEESFQVFMVPILLLYSTSVFKYDVVQNGYLVSLLQGTRALYLTVCFPWAVAKARVWLKRWQERRLAEERREGTYDDDERDEDGEAADETSRLNGSGAGTDSREDRGRLDIGIMLFSYLLCAASFGMLAMTRTWSEQYEDGRKATPPWIGVAIGIIGLQLGSGATSLRTALLVNAVSEQADEQEELQYRENLQRRLASRYGAIASTHRQRERVSSGATNSYLGSVENDAGSFHAHHERHQSKALAANQILCTAVYALIPLLTSKIFGAGLSTDQAELVWIFKGIMALISALATLALLFSYSASANDETHA